MDNIIINFQQYINNNSAIDISALKASRMKLANGLIDTTEPTAAVTGLIPVNHAAEPIKRLEDIDRICKYLINAGRYRDYMLFVVGINFGLRASDLRELRFCNLINDNCTFKDTFPVFEKKTRNTRKKKKNRYITVNMAVVEAVTMYLEHTPGVKLGDYMFTSLSNNGKNTDPAPIAVYSIERILKGIADELGLNIHMSTHTLRKTFCYHQMLMSHNDARKLMLLQKMLGHATMAQTLDYIGITAEEIEDAYRELNLGSRKYNYMNGCVLEEREAAAI